MNTGEKQFRLDRGKSNCQIYRCPYDIPSFDPIKTFSEPYFHSCIHPFP